jgi:hypothetical protein
VSPEDDPKASLTNAVERLSEYEGVTMTFGLASTTDSLVAMSEGDLTPDNAQKILDSSFTITSKQGDNPEEAQAEVAASIAGNDGAVELKFLDDTLYMRADVAGIMESFGQDTSQVGQIKQQASAQPGFEFIGPALDGEWLALSGLEQALQQFGGSTQAAEPSAAQQQAIDGFAAAIGDSSEVTTGDAEGPGTHLIATVPLRDAYGRFVELADEFGAGQAAQLPPASKVPDEEVRLDAWVDGDELTQFQLDFTQFAAFEDGEPLPEGVESFALQIGLEEFTDSVEAPSGATQVDINQLLQGFIGVGGVPAS